MKTILMTLLVLCANIICGQDMQILQMIKENNASLPDIEARFVQTKHNTINDKKTISQGILYIAGNDKMAMHYDEPSTDLLVINGKDFYMKQGEHAKLYNTDNNKMMASLSNTLLSCIRGDVEAFANANDASITTQKEDDAYVVTLSSNKKKMKGYAKIILFYDLKTQLLFRMQMEEFNGIVNMYEMSDIKSDATIDAAVFQIPD